MFEDWNDVELDLRVEATLALDEGLVPDPLLVAFGGGEPIAVVRLRPFGGEEVLTALVEVLALLLPLGATRLALGLPAHARPDAATADCDEPDDSADDPVDPTRVPSGAGVDAHDDAGEDPGSGPPSSPVLLLATAEVEGQAAPCLRARLLPLVFDGECWQWQEDEGVPLDADQWEVTRALGVLLASRDSLQPHGSDELHLHAQLGRCLLLGHVVALSPQVADDLEPSRLAADP